MRSKKPKLPVWLPGDNITISYGVNYCAFTTAYPQTQLLKVLRVRVPGFIHMPRYKDGMWDGYSYYLSKYTAKFPTGLLPRVYAILITGCDPLDEEQLKIIPSAPIKVRFTFQENAKPYFHTSFLKLFLNEPVPHFTTMVNKQIIEVELNTNFFDLITKQINYGPANNLPISTLLNNI